MAVRKKAVKPAAAPVVEKVKSIIPTGPFEVSPAVVAELNKLKQRKRRVDPVEPVVATSTPERHLGVTIKAIAQGMNSKLPIVWDPTTWQKNSTVKKKPMDEETKAYLREKGLARKALRSGPKRGAVTLQDLCQTLKIEPSDARKALRKTNCVKPDGGWAWETEDEAMAVLRSAGLLDGKVEKRVGADKIEDDSKKAVKTKAAIEQTKTKVDKKRVTQDMVRKAVKKIKRR